MMTNHFAFESSYFINPALVDVLAILVEVRSNYPCLIDHSTCHLILVQRSRGDSVHFEDEGKSAFVVRGQVCDLSAELLHCEDTISLSV